MNEKINILLADDHVLFISGLSALLVDSERAYNIEVAHDGNTVMQMVSQKQPDLILLDIGMPGTGGMEILKYLHRLYPAIKVIMLSSYNDVHLIEKAQRIGAYGYLVKDSSIEELQQAIADVTNGKYCFPTITPSDANGNDIHPIVKQFNLTNREMEIIQLIKAESTNKQIAEKLFLSVYTVETHRKNIMHKLQINNAASLMKFILDFDL